MTPQPLPSRAVPDVEKPELLRAVKSPALAAAVVAALVAALLLLPASPASAATFTVDTTVDDPAAQDCDGSDPDVDCSLRGAVLLANGSAEADTINLPDPNGVPNSPGPAYTLTVTGAGEEGAATGDLDITSDVTIVGMGGRDVVVIDAAGLVDRILDVQPSGILDLLGVTLTNGTASEAGTAGRGGAVRVVDGTLDLTSVVVVANTAVQAGGGIENAGGEVSAFAADFSDNEATGDTTGVANGGALHNTASPGDPGVDGLVTVTGGTVSGNSAAEGGGFWNGGGGALRVMGTTFDGNTAIGTDASQGGGALYNEGAGNLNVSSADFVDNTATSGSGSGGAILNTETGTVLIVNGATFDSNAANRAGGAIENAGAQQARITDSDFDDNEATGSTGAGNGGAIHNSGSVVVVNRATAGGNSAVEGGGFWNGGGDLHILSATFETNTATGTDATQGGGALYNEGGGVLNVSNADFIDNTAIAGSGSGGAILNTGTGTEALVRDSEFVGNSANRAGGAIENADATAGISGTDFDDNEATGSTGAGNGGALHNGGGDVSVNGSEADGNRAVEGGGFWNGGGGDLDIRSTIFVRNTATGTDATQGGGALYNEGAGTVAVDGGFFIDNAATDGAGSGGAILNTETGTVLTIESPQSFRTVFDGNAANRAGGAIENANATATISGADFDDNEATGSTGAGNGGALHNGGGEVTVTDSSATGNRAVEGGAFWTSGSFAVDGTTVTDNVASSEGGAFYNSAGSFDFADVDATNGGAETDAVVQGNVYAEGGGAATASAAGSTFTDSAGTAEPTCEVLIGVQSDGNTDDDGTCFAEDTTAPDAPTIDDPDPITADNEEAFAVTGDAEPGSEVGVTFTDSDGDSVTATTTAGPDGSFSVTADVSSLDDGAITITATATDDAGNTSDEATATTTKDTGDDGMTPPPDDGDDMVQAPSIDDPGDIDEDNEDAFTVTGDAEPGSTVEVTFTDSDGNSVTESTVADDDGSFSVTADVGGLSDGEITIAATATLDGEESDATTIDVTKETDEDGMVPPPDGDGVEVDRVFGEGRTETAIQISQADFGDGEAGAVVLTRPDIFPDALAGTPLAVQEDAPLLLTGSAGLEPQVGVEIQRVLPDGATVYLLGGVQALSEQVQADVEALGFDVVCYGGFNRFDTASIIATDGIDAATQILLADGSDFPDAVTAGAAAGAVGGAVLLTGGDTVPVETQALLDTLGVTPLFAIGGPAASAVPAATGIVGADRIATSVAVAEQFFDAPPVVGLATGEDFPDALAGGASVAHDGGPLVLTFTDTLGQPVSDYLVSEQESIDRVVLFGGTQALSEAVERAVRDLLD